VSRPPGPSRISLLFYRCIRNLVVAFCRIYWREQVTGRQHVPATGAFILAPVHRSNIDTPLVAAVTTRRLRYMGKDSMWKVHWVGAVFTALGAFPVRRGRADREALRRCVEVLEGGEALVLFPEGSRRSGPTVEEVFEGAAYLAARTGAPIVPVGIGGSEAAMPRGARFIRPVRTRVVVGAPLRPPAGPEGSRVARRAVRELTAELQGALQRLLDEAAVSPR